MSLILLVEDNELNRDMLSRRLKKHGYDFCFAHNGVEAIQQSQDMNPDLILMDLSLPEIDGWEATRQIKSNPKTSHIPIIALTAHAMSEDKKKAFQAGCDGYATKPIQLIDLKSQIESLLNPN